MALYLKDGKVYETAIDGKVHGVSIHARDKVVTHRELESVSVVRSATVKEVPEGAQPVTLDTLVAKFNVSEEHPLEWPKAKRAAASR